MVCLHLLHYRHHLWLFHVKWCTVYGLELLKQTLIISLLNDLFANIILHSLLMSFPPLRSRPGIFVHYLVPGSKAEECGLVHPGDRIIEANGVDLRYSTVDEAATFMTVREKLLPF